MPMSIGDKKAKESSRDVSNLLKEIPTTKKYRSPLFPDTADT